MGKKNKKDKKQSGADKTARKTDKNLEKKMKKTRDAAGEEDIEVLIAKFRAEDRKKSEVTERKCDPPSARWALSCLHAYCTLTCTLVVSNFSKWVMRIFTSKCQMTVYIGERRSNLRNNSPAIIFIIGKSKNNLK